MNEIDSDTVMDAIRDCLRRFVKTNGDEGPAIQLEDDLLEIVDSFEFVRLVLDLEASLEVQLPLDQIDLASIAKIDRLIEFIYQHG